MTAAHKRLHRLLAQVGRVLEINGLDVVTRKVVEAARASLVSGKVDVIARHTKQL